MKKELILSVSTGKTPVMEVAPTESPDFVTLSIRISKEDFEAMYDRAAFDKSNIYDLISNTLKRRAKSCKKNLESF